jgi:hypothetical protein
MDMSMLTEDRSSVLDDTLPSIFEEDEEEGEEEILEPTSPSPFPAWGGRDHDELYAVSTPSGSMRKRTRGVFGSGEGLGLSFDPSFPSPLRLDGFGLLSSYHPQERMRQSMMMMEDEGLELGLSPQFLREISHTFVGAAPSSTLTPPREMSGKGRGNGGVGATTISSVNKRTGKVSSSTRAGSVWR